MSKKKEIVKYTKVLAVDVGTCNRCSIALFDTELDKLLYYDTIYRRDVKNNLAHRQSLIKLINNAYEKYGIDVLIFESISLFAKGQIRLPTILSLNKVQTTIINEFSDKFDIYKVDVRSWRAKVLGSAKLQKDDVVKFIQKKYPTVNLLDEIIKPIKKEIIFEINHDLADAISISMLLNNDYTTLKDKNKMNYE